MGKRAVHIDRLEEASLVITRHPIGEALYFTRHSQVWLVKRDVKRALKNSDVQPLGYETKEYASRIAEKLQNSTVTPFIAFRCNAISITRTTF